MKERPAPTNPAKFKKCRDCGEVKPREEFCKIGKTGRRSLQCKKCHNAYQVERRRKIKEGTWIAYPYPKQEV